MVDYLLLPTTYYYYLLPTYYIVGRILSIYMWQFIKSFKKYGCYYSI